MPVIPSASSSYQHTTSAKQIIRRALRLLGKVGEGEDPTPQDLADGLEALNQLLDSWNTEKLIAYTVERKAWTLASGSQDLEIGPDADLNTGRPLVIEQGLAFVKTSNQEYELDILTPQQWAGITDKTSTGRPSDLYYEAGFPRGTVHLWPKTDQAYDLVIYTWVLLSQITGVIASLALPPGYARALSTNLALEIAPMYDTSAAAEVVAMAIEAKGKIKSMNLRPLDIECDSALIQGGWYNITSGDLI